MSRRDTRAKPYQRSITTHIRSIELSAALNTGIPTDEADGVDVSDWLSLVIAVHPTNPDISSITAGANVVLRPWRYKKASQEGTSPGSGQWYADIDWTVPLDGDGTSQMEQAYAVWNAEKIYFQVISVADPGVETPTFRVEHYGIGPKYAEAPEFFESVSASAAASAAGTTDVNLIQVAGNAVNVGAGAAGTGTLRVIYASDSPGIGAHDAATAVAGFRSLFVATTSDPAAVADQDDVHPITDVYGRLILAGYNRVGDHLEVGLIAESLGLGEHDVATEADGMRALFVATTADPAAVADQDDVHPITDALGRIILAGYNRTGDHLEVGLIAESLGLGAHDVATETDGFRALAVATNVDPAAVANQDDVHLITDLYGRLIILGADREGELIRVQETAPIYTHIAPDLIEESSMGTAGSPYVYYIDLDTFYRMSLQTAITLGSAGAGNVALTIHGTVEDDDPDLTARTYLDRTTAISGSPSITVAALIEDLNGIYGNYTAIKLSWAVVNASNDSAIRMDTKRFVGG